MITITSIERIRENVKVFPVYRRKKSRFDRLHARKVSTFFPQTLMGGQQRDTLARTCGIGVFATSFVLGQASLKSVCICRPPLLFQRDQINSLRNGRDYDLKLIENSFRDPEDGFWGKTAQRVLKYTRSKFEASVFHLRLNS